MKCKKCGSEWKTDANRSASITVCPFCQEKIVAEKSSDWQFFDNTKELLAYIATEYGIAALFGKKHFSDHTAPLIPQGEKNLVKLAFDCGAVKILQDNMNSDRQSKEIAIKQAVGKLTGIYSIAKDAAERVVWEFSNAIGWDIPEPQDPVISDQTSDSGVTNPPVIPDLAPSPDTSRLMIRAWQFAEDNDWKEAADYFNKVLDITPTYSPAFLGLLCVEFKLSSEHDLANVKNPDIISNHKYYKRASTDPVIKARLDGYIQTIKNQIDAEQKAATAEAERRRKIAEEAARKKRVQDAFNNACEIMDSSLNPNDFLKAITSFTSIDSNYQDINSAIKGKIAECENKKAAAEEAIHKKRVQDDFDSVCRIMDSAQSSDDYCKAIASFGNIDSNYQDISNQIKSKIAECERGKAYIEAAFRQKYGVLLDRLSSEGKAEAEERRKAAQAQLDEENTKVKAAVETKYAQLQQQYEVDYKIWQEKVHELKASYEIAYKNWEEDANKRKAQSEMWKSQKLCPHDGGTLKGLRSKKCTACGKEPSEPIAIHPAPTQPKYPLEPQIPKIPTFTPRKLETESILPSDVVATIKGELVFVKLGGIDWRVLTVENNRALLISEKILETRPYNTDFADMTWEQCTLRKYLNSDFYNKLGVAKSEIAETRNKNPNNHWYGISGGNATADKVFLLSLDELVKYFGDSGDLRNKKRYGWNVSKYVLESDGYFLHDQYDGVRIAKDGRSEMCWWWLRSPGGDSFDAAFVYKRGYVGVLGIGVSNDEGGVRPALWINL